MTPRHGSDEPPRSPDASMTLITETYRRALDAGYAEAAARRTAGTEPRRTWRSTAGMVVLAIGLGLGVTAATQALREPAGSALAARRLLETQIVQREAEADALQSDISSMTAEITALQEELLGDEGQPARDEIEAGAVQAGIVPASGPGLRVVLTDAPSDLDEQIDPSLRVQDVDLQVVVNGLWAAGAEAIAVNGERLTAMTAIRSAGDAVLVDLRALTSPYTVDAIGDAVTMQTELARAGAGQHMATLRSTFGIGVQLSSESRLELPGAGMVSLYEAKVPEPAEVLGADPDAEARAPGDAGVAGSAGLTGRDGT